MPEFRGDNEFNTDARLGHLTQEPDGLIKLEVDLSGARTEFK